jgi:competence protein ComEC
MDHYKGIYELTEEYPVGRIGIPADYQKSIEEEYVSRARGGCEEQGEDATVLPDHGKIMYVREGERITISDDVYIEPIWPPPGAGSSIDIDDPNEHNMVYVINYKGVRIMVTGDLLEEDELKMISYYSGTDTLNCDILKVAHHGSKSSSSEAFLKAASPEIAVIEVGLNNFYGHPHQQTLDRLEALGIRIYRTDLNGAVGIDISGRSLSVDKTRDVLELTHGL